MKSSVEMVEDMMGDDRRTTHSSADSEDEEPKTGSGLFEQE